MLVRFDDQTTLTVSRPFGIVRGQIRNDNAIGRRPTAEHNEEVSGGIETVEGSTDLNH